MESPCPSDVGFIDALEAPLAARSIRLISARVEQSQSEWAEPLPEPLLSNVAGPWEGFLEYTRHAPFGFWWGDQPDVKNPKGFSAGGFGFMNVPWMLRGELWNLNHFAITLTVAFLHNGSNQGCHWVDISPPGLKGQEREWNFVGSNWKPGAKKGDPDVLANPLYPQVYTGGLDNPNGKVVADITLTLSTIFLPDLIRFQLPEHVATR